MVSGVNAVWTLQVVANTDFVYDTLSSPSQAIMIISLSSSTVI